MKTKPKKPVNQATKPKPKKRKRNKLTASIMKVVKITHDKQNKKTVEVIKEQLKGKVATELSIQMNFDSWKEASYYYKAVI